jgi:hypothetical protein
MSYAPAKFRKITEFRAGVSSGVTIGAFSGVPITAALLDFSLTTYLHDARRIHCGLVAIGGGREGLVSLFIHQRVELGGIGNPHLEEPAIARRIGIHHSGFFRELFVHVHDLA